MKVNKRAVRRICAEVVERATSARWNASRWLYWRTIKVWPWSWVKARRDARTMEVARAQRLIAATEDVARQIKLTRQALIYGEEERTGPVSPREQLEALDPNGAWAIHSRQFRRSQREAMAAQLAREEGRDAKEGRSG